MRQPAFRVDDAHAGRLVVQPPGGAHDLVHDVPRQRHEPTSRAGADRADCASGGSRPRPAARRPARGQHASPGRLLAGRWDNQRRTAHDARRRRGGRTGRADAVRVSASALTGDGGPAELGAVARSVAAPARRSERDRRAGRGVTARPDGRRARSAATPTAERRPCRSGQPERGRERSGWRPVRGDGPSRSVAGP